jgi:hypothetical protein
MNAIRQLLTRLIRAFELAPPPQLPPSEHRGHEMVVARCACGDLTNGYLGAHEHFPNVTTDVNPATGLPMTDGGVDIGGSAFGHNAAFERLYAELQEKR